MHAPGSAVDPAEVDLDAAGPAVGNDAALWSAWRDRADYGARETLIEKFLPFARIIAGSVFAKRFDNDIPFDEYFQFGSLGLIEAVDHYDPSRGAQFKTFAFYRIRGAILNGLPHLTEKAQQIAATQKLRRERLEAIKEAAADSEPDTDTARTPADLLRYLSEVGIGLALSVMLEGTGMIEPSEETVAVSQASPEVAYFQREALHDLRKMLQDLVHRLPRQERTVIGCHYQQEMSFGEVADMMGVTRGRISQLHRQGLLHLRQAMKAVSLCDVAF